MSFDVGEETPPLNRDSNQKVRDAGDAVGELHSIKRRPVFMRRLQIVVVSAALVLITILALVIRRSVTMLQGYGVPADVAPFHVFRDPKSYPGLLWIPPDLPSPAPLLIFLHGMNQFAVPPNLSMLVASEGGTPPAEIYCDAHPNFREDCSHAAQGFKHLFVLAAPQAENVNRGWEKDRISNLVDFLISDGPKLGLQIDPRRLYITGWSAGGHGVLVAGETGRFAAMAPVTLPCSDGDRKALSDPDLSKDVLLRTWRPDREQVNVSKLLRIPIWAFHAQDDTLISPECTTDFINYLKRKGAPPDSIKVTVYSAIQRLPRPGWHGKRIGHLSSVLAYMNQDLYIWLLQFSKPSDEVALDEVARA